MSELNVGFSQEFKLPADAFNNPLSGSLFNDQGTQNVFAWDPRATSKFDWSVVETDVLPLPCANDREGASAISSQMKNLIKDIEDFRKNVSGFASKRLQFIGEVQGIVDKYAGIISGKISNWIKWIQEEIMKKINAAAVAAGVALPINARFPIRESQAILVQALFCLFNKILDNLESMIRNFLLELIDKFINVPLCAIENLLQSLLGKILGLITSVLSSISSIISSIASLVDQVLSSIIDLLELFTCEEKEPCPDTKQWNILEGGGNNGGGLNLSFTDILSKAKNTAEQFSNIASAIYDPNTNAVLGIDIGDLSSLNLNDALQDLTCTGQPIFCTVPRAVFFGGGGSGAEGNPIVSAAGQILGIDVTSSGSGYTSEPFISIVDDCGRGRGAVVKSRIGPVPPDLNFTANQLDDNIYELCWKTKRAVRVETNFGGTGLSNCYNVSPEESTTYSVTAIGQKGDTIKQEIIINPTSGSTTNLPSSTSTSPSPTPTPSPSPTPSITSGSGIGSTTQSSLSCPTIPQLGEIRQMDPVIDPVDIGVTGVVVIDPGFGYLTGPDGTLGGDGRTWAKSDETIVRRLDGTYDLPYSPGQTIDLKQCDEVTFPGKPPFRPDTDTTVTAPDYVKPTDKKVINPYPNKNSEYPVVLYLCDVEISNSGAKYSSNDKVIITPDNGATLRATFDSNGSVKEIRIIDSGIGFKERPIIYIESETGFNASFVPILCVNRVGDDTRDPQISGSDIINIIDCVGKS